MIEPISLVGAVPAELYSTQISSTKAPDFINLVEESLMTVNDSIQTADSKFRSLIIGEAENTHEVMLAISKAKTQMDLTVEIRNRLIEGYQEIMRMSV